MKRNLLILFLSLAAVSGPALGMGSKRSLYTTALGFTKGLGNKLGSTFFTWPRIKTALWGTGIAGGLRGLVCPGFPGTPEEEALLKKNKKIWNAYNPCSEIKKCKYDSQFRVLKCKTEKRKKIEIDDAGGSTSIAGYANIFLDKYDIARLKECWNYWRPNGAKRRANDPDALFKALKHQREVSEQ